MKRIISIAAVLVTAFIGGIASLPIHFVSAATTYYWYGNGGNWTDYTNHWSLNSGNSPANPAPAAPTSAENVRFDSNSFSGGGQTVTVNASANCLDMDWTGATNSPTFAGGNNITIYGSLTFISGMTSTFNAAINFRTNNTVKTINIPLTLTPSFVEIGAGGAGTDTWTLQSALNITNGALHINRGTLITGNNTITCGAVDRQGTANACTITLGSSTVNCSSVDFNSNKTGLTISNNTATINCSGSFGGNSVATWGTLNLTGATSTITGSNTIAQLGLTRSGVQTITFTDGTTQTIGNLTRSAGVDVKTLQGSGAAGWNITKNTAGYLDLDYLSVSRSTASPDNTFYAGTHSTNGGNNIRWYFTLPQISPPSNLAVSSNGVITWAHGTNASNITLVRGTSGYPTSISDGVVLYTGTGVTYTDQNPNPDVTTYYYSAWGVSGAYTSSTSSTTSFGGTAMTMLGNAAWFIGLAVLAVGLLGGGYISRRPILAMVSSFFWLIAGLWAFNLSTKNWAAWDIYLGMAFGCLFFVLVGMFAPVALRQKDEVEQFTAENDTQKFYREWSEMNDGLNMLNRRPEQKRLISPDEAQRRIDRL